MAGPNGWGLAGDVAEAARTLRSAVDQGLQVIDTAWYYGPDCVLELIARTLCPYPDSLRLVVKVGNSREAASRAYIPSVEPKDLRAAIERTLRSLDVDAVSLVLLRWRDDLDHGRAFDEAWQEVLAFRAEGKTTHVGLSNVPVRHIRRALEFGEVSAVSNAYSVLDRSDEHSLLFCESRGITYLPYYPLMRGDAAQHGLIRQIAERAQMAPAQVALRWLVDRSEVVIPIPGTANATHVTQNLNVLSAQLPQGDAALLDDLGRR